MFPANHVSWRQEEHRCASFGAMLLGYLATASSFVYRETRARFNLRTRVSFACRDVLFSLALA